MRKVIETFARFGAPDRILVEGKPHIGSDLLPFAVESMREELVAGGCEVRFETPASTTCCYATAASRACGSPTARSSTATG